MPSFFSSMSGATMSLYRGLIDQANPKTYEQIFAGVDRSQVILVSGEQDNTFVPGGGGGGGTGAWGGLDEDGTVARGATKKYVTPTLAAGRYKFAMTGTSDADLYVRIGREPTTSTYDCRPYKNGSNETCVVNLPADAKIYVNVRGYASSSDFSLVGSKE
ncbi:MAG: PPC domain-containing protein [Kofleriaceae bacterium]|nr:PPC domain-containing protein [Kofleriaceae bacterium]